MDEIEARELRRIVAVVRDRSLPDVTKAIQDRITMRARLDYAKKHAPRPRHRGES